MGRQWHGCGPLPLAGKFSVVAVLQGLLDPHIACLYDQGVVHQYLGSFWNFSFALEDWGGGIEHGGSSLSMNAK